MSRVILHTQCPICEWFVDVRGECQGRSADLGCDGFKQAENRQGSVDLETGDVVSVAPPPPAEKRGTAEGGCAEGHSRGSRCLSGCHTPGERERAVQEGYSPAEAMLARSARPCGPDAEIIADFGFRIADSKKDGAAVSSSPIRNPKSEIRNSPVTKADLGGADAATARTRSKPLQAVGLTIVLLALALAGLGRERHAAVAAGPDSQRPRETGSEAADSRRAGAEMSHLRAPASGAAVSSRFRVPVSPRLRVFLDALRQVESGGNDSAVGDGGRSLGPYQIQLAYWADAVAQSPTAGRARPGAAVPQYGIDVWNRGACERVMLAYWRRYAPAALAAAQGGDERRAMPALQTLARVHNGGPRGARNAATLAYWRRVEAEMKKGER